MTAFRRFSAIPAIAALVFSVSGSFADAANTWNVLGQYQYVISTGTSDSTLTSTSDWFSGVNTYYRTGTAGPAPTGPGTVYSGSASALDFTGAAYTTTGTVGSGTGAMYNYISKSPVTNTTNLITNTPMQTGNPPSPNTLVANLYVPGQGMSYIVQDAANPLTAVNGSNFRIRSAPGGEINITGASNTATSNSSRGITFLGYTSVTPTTLSSGTYVFATALGTNGNDPNYYTDSFRAAIQDTTGQWWLSAWKTGTFSGTPTLPYTFDMKTGAYSNGSTGTASAFTVTGTTQGWYQYTPATVASSSLSLLDTSTAPYSQYFTGTAQAFGIYFGQLTPTPTGSASPQGGIGFRWRGFEVINSPAAVPEPATVGMTALGLCALVATRVARRRQS